MDFVPNLLQQHNIIKPKILTKLFMSLLIKEVVGLISFLSLKKHENSPVIPSFYAYLSVVSLSPDGPVDLVFFCNIRWIMFIYFLFIFHHH